MSAGHGRSPFCKVGQPERWRPSRRPAEAGGQGDNRRRQETGCRLPKLGSHVVTFEPFARILCCLLVRAVDAYQKPRWRRPGAPEEGRAGTFDDPNDCAADEFYDGKPWVDLSVEERMQGLKTFAGVDMQQTSDDDFCRHIFRVLKMDVVCSCKNVPCGQWAHGCNETRRMAVHANAWQGAG